MSLSELRQLISLIGTILLLALVLLIPIYLVAVRKAKKHVLQVLWALFWRGPILILLGITLYPEMAVLSAVLILVVIVGPLEIRSRFVGAE